jgi:hypothetical protein
LKEISKHDYHDLGLACQKAFYRGEFGKFLFPYMVGKIFFDFAHALSLSRAEPGAI